MKPKILIVDDEELFLMSMQELLQNHFNVSIAESATDALQIMKDTGEFAVIITDIHMPEMDGIQLLEKATALFPRTVRIILTSDFTQQATQDAVNNANIFAYLKKPCPIASFAKTVRNAIKQYNSVKQQNLHTLKVLIQIVQIYNEQLSPNNPEIFSYCADISKITHQLLKLMKLSKIINSEIHLILEFLPLVFLDLSKELCENILSGVNLSDAQNKEFFDSIHKISMKRLPDSQEIHSIARSMLFITKGLNGSGYPIDITSLSQIPAASRIIKLVMGYKKLLLQGIPPHLTKPILESSGLYDSKYLNELEEIFQQNTDWKELEVSADQLITNMFLKEDIETPEGGIIVARNEKISIDQINKIRNFANTLGHSIKVYQQVE